MIAVLNHPQLRAAERYGVALTLAELRALEADAREGRGVVLRRQPDGAEVVLLKFGERVFAVAFDQQQGRIKTFLGPDQLNRSDRILKRTGRKPRRAQRNGVSGSG